MMATENAFLSGYHVTWLPHPTRDVMSAVYPWTEDNCRDFLLQTGVSMCAGARPNAAGQPINIAALTPQNPSSSNQQQQQQQQEDSPATSPSYRVRRQEQAELRDMVRAVASAKQAVYEQQVQVLREQQQQQQQPQENEAEQQQLIDIPPFQLAPRDVQAAFLPSAHFMSTRALHPLAISCAWRHAFQVEPMQQLVDAVTQHAQPAAAANAASPVDDDDDDDDAAAAAATATATATPVTEDTWRDIYDAALEDRNLAATHLRGMISRKLTLDRFSVREFSFLWQLISGPKTMALKWFRWRNKQQQQLLPQPTATAAATPAARGRGSASSVTAGGTSSVAVTSTTPSTAAQAFVSALSRLSGSGDASPSSASSSSTSSSTLFTGLPPPICPARRDAILFELRALYFAVLEFYGIGKDGKVKATAEEEDIEKQKQAEEEQHQQQQLQQQQQQQQKEDKKKAEAKVPVRTRKQQQKEKEEAEAAASAAAAAAAEAKPKAPVRGAAAKKAAATATAARQLTFLDDDAATTAPTAKKSAPSRRQRTAVGSSSTGETYPASILGSGALPLFEDKVAGRRGHRQHHHRHHHAQQQQDDDGQKEGEEEEDMIVSLLQPASTKADLPEAVTIVVGEPSASSAAPSKAGGAWKLATVRHRRQQQECGDEEVEVPAPWREFYASCFAAISNEPGLVMKNEEYLRARM